MDFFYWPQKTLGESHFFSSEKNMIFNKHTLELIPLGWVSSQPVLDVHWAGHSSELVLPSSPCGQQEEIVTFWGYFM